MLFIPACHPLLADSGALLPLIPACRPLLADSGGFIPLISSYHPLSEESEGFIPLISSYRPLSAESEGFIPLISSYRPLSAESEGFIPLIFQASDFWGFCGIPDTKTHSSFRRTCFKFQRNLFTTDAYRNFLYSQDHPSNGWFALGV
jgi:hypothetical protein